MSILSGQIHNDSRYTRLFFEEHDDNKGGAREEKEEKVVVEPTQARIDFNARFAHNREDLLPKPIEKVEGEGEETDNKVVVPTKIEPIKKGPGANMPKVLEDKRRAEAEREEYKTKLDKFEKEEKPALETKIADLEKKLNEGGHTAAQEKVLQDKLDAAEKKLTEREESLGNENKQLRSRLSFHDIQEDPDFHEKYVKPITASYTEAIDSFQGDDQKVTLLRQAAMANGAALNSTKPEERQAYEKQRNTILSQIADSMDEFTAGQFKQAMNAYIRSSKEHANALGRHEETASEIKKQRAEAKSRAASETFAKWTDHSKRISSEFDDQAKIEGDLADVVKELKIAPDDELTANAKTVEKIITGRATMEESVAMLHRGRILPAVLAKSKALEHQNAELRATIAKLRGTKPKGDAKDGRETAEKTEDINHRFRASRPGAMGRPTE